jgi:hypothetical protein
VRAVQSSGLLILFFVEKIAFIHDSRTSSVVC